MADRLVVFFHPCVFDHDTGQGFFEADASPYLPILERHPENGDRTRNMLSVLQQGPICEALDWHRGEAAIREDLECFHTTAYVDELESIASTESRSFSSTTVFGPGSYPLCCAAAGQTQAAAMDQT